MEWKIIKIRGLQINSIMGNEKAGQTRVNEEALELLCCIVNQVFSGCRESRRFHFLGSWILLKSKMSWYGILCLFFFVLCKGARLTIC